MTETSRLKLGAHAASGNRKPRKAMLAPLGALLVFLLCACPAEGLIPSSSLAIRSCRHARRYIILLMDAVCSMAASYQHMFNFHW